MTYSVAAALADALEATTPARIPDATQSSPAATAAWHLIRRVRARHVAGKLQSQPEKLDGEPGWRVQISLRDILANMPAEERDGAGDQQVSKYLADTRNLVRLTLGRNPVYWLPDLPDGWRDIHPATLARHRRALQAVKTVPPSGQDVLDEDPDGEDWGLVTKHATIHACTYCPTARGLKTDADRRDHERLEHPGAYWSNTAMICVKHGCEYPARGDAEYRNHLDVVHRVTWQDRAEQDALCTQATDKANQLRAASTVTELPAPRPHLRPARDAGPVLDQIRAVTTDGGEREERISAEDFRAAVELLPQITTIITRYHAQQLAAAV